MRFGQDQVAFLKPEDNGGLESGGESEAEGGGGEMMGDVEVVYDDVEENKKKNKTQTKV